MNKLAVSYGMGVDSTAMLIGLYAWGIRPDVILFADTGGEKPETYAYLAIINEWLESVGFPKVTVIRYVPKIAPYDTLEGNCLSNLTMPSLAFGGRRGCSVKWKGEPLDRHVRKLFPDQQVLRAIGYDAGTKDMKRGKGVKDTPESKWWYPLRTWDWDRDECVRQIEAAGLPVPVKSCCFFCPAMKPDELTQLAKSSPDLARRAVAIEDGAQARQAERRAEGKKAILGLWGVGSKGIRAPKKPGKWRDFLEENHPEVLDV